jgi:single-stranded DNA-binding protein
MANFVVITGRLGADPKIRENFATFPVADSKKYKKDGDLVEITRWHDVVTGNINQAGYLQKGMKVTVFGEINYNTDKEKRKFTNIRANFIEFGERKPDETPEEPKKKSKPKQELDDSEDDLPF